MKATKHGYTQQNGQIPSHVKPEELCTEQYILQDHLTIKHRDRGNSSKAIEIRPMVISIGRGMRELLKFTLRKLVTWVCLFVNTNYSLTIMHCFTICKFISLKGKWNKQKCGIWSSVWHAKKIKLSRSPFCCHLAWRPMSVPTRVTFPRTTPEGWLTLSQ